MLHEIPISSSEKQELIDITEEIKNLIQKSDIKDGICIIYCPHTTAGITINENYDPDVRQDILYALNKAIPNNNYKHTEGNADAHVKSTLIGTEKTLIINNKELILGRWQGILFCEFDGPRQRKVLIKIIGD